jgi:hypothetical protein
MRATPLAVAPYSPLLRLLFLALTTAAGAPAAAAPASSPSTGRYVHPGIIVSRAMLEQMRDDVRAQREPSTRRSSKRALGL